MDLDDYLSSVDSNDKLEDIATLPKSPVCASGSSCLCLENSSVWKLGDDNEWHEI